jgi:hypothetical protein
MDAAAARGNPHSFATRFSGTAVGLYIAGGKGLPRAVFREFQISHRCLAP